MIAVVDYGVGNLFSLVSSLAAVGADAVVTGDAEVLRKADKIILPGVGAFGDAAAKLRATGLDRVIIEEAKAGKPLLGICLGMQLLFEKSFEYGEHEGLGLIKGEIRPIADVIPAEKVGDFDTELCEEFWQAFTRTSNITLHIVQNAGRNSHHIIEGAFKAVARALRAAVKIDPDSADEIPSTKGVL